MNKRGDIQSIIIMICMIIVFVIIAIIFSKIFIAVLNNLSGSGKFDSDTVEIMDKVESKTIPYLDLFIFIFLVGSILGLIISSIFIDTFPGLTIFFIILLVVAILIAGIFSNVYAEFKAEPTMASTASQFTYTNLIMGSNFPVIILFIGVIVIIILYGKSRSGGRLSV